MTAPLVGAELALASDGAKEIDDLRSRRDWPPLHHRFSVEIAGSAQLGEIMGAAQCGIVEHVKALEGALIAGMAHVKDSVPAGVRMGGTPARPFNDWVREVAAVKKLSKNGRGDEAASPRGEAASLESEFVHNVRTRRWDEPFLRASWLVQLPSLSPSAQHWRPEMWTGSSAASV
jgi:hypothetical protein